MSFSELCQIHLKLQDKAKRKTKGITLFEFIKYFLQPPSMATEFYFSFSLQVLKQNEKQNNNNTNK